LPLRASAVGTEELTILRGPCSTCWQRPFYGSSRSLTEEERATALV